MPATIADHGAPLVLSIRGLSRWSLVLPHRGRSKKGVGARRDRWHFPLAAGNENKPNASVEKRPKLLQCHISIMTEASAQVSCVTCRWKITSLNYNWQTHPKKKGPRVKVHMNEIYIRHCTCYSTSVMTSKAQHFTSCLGEKGEKNFTGLSLSSRPKESDDWHGDNVRAVLARTVVSDNVTAPTFVLTVLLMSWNFSPSRDWPELNFWLEPI